MIQFKAALMAGLIAAGLFSSAPVYSDYEEFFEQRARAKEEARKQFEKLYKRAERGDKKAQYQVGLTYALPSAGEVKQSAAAALEWFLKSARQGYLPAQEEAAKYFYHGLGGEKDLYQAFDWYQEAARQGSIDANYSLGLMWMKGEGAVANPRKAVEHLEIAARKGNEVTAASTLVDLYKKHFPEEGERQVYWMEFCYAEEQWYGRELVAAYSEGKLVPRNDAKVFYFLNDMYQRGDAGGDQLYQLATLYEEGRGVARNTAKAEELYSQAAKARHPDAVLRKLVKDNQSALEKGDPQALFTVAGAHIQVKRQNLSPREIDQVIHWLEEASNKNHQGARRLLAGFYSDERSGHRQSSEKSLALYEQIAREGDTDVQLHLVQHYLNQDKEKALYWLTTAANQGDARAQYALAEIHFKGAWGLEQDQLKAVNLYRASARQGHPLAMYEMGHMYDHGHAVEKNLNQALEWYEKAAREGVPAAIEKLKELKGN